jgi:hypothetical protein
MAARSPRRSFASPFVVTLAASLPVAACYVQTRTPPPTHARGDSPPPQAQPDLPTHTENPPRPVQPTEQPSQPHTAMPTHATERPQGQPPVQQTQPPQPANPMPRHATERPQRPPPMQQTSTPVVKEDRYWTVTRSGSTCQVSPEFSCPKPQAGVAVSCNPPRPVAYPCPSSMTTGSVRVMQYAGSDYCQVVITTPPLKCPPNAICNPPPPQKVTCPQ